jgi:hypothetical protein
VGIGTTTPITTLQVMDANAGGSPSAATPNQGLLISGNATGGSLNMGIDATGASFYSWIQSRNRTSNSVYPIALNPNGGNVGIGTSSPGGKLDINQAGGQLRLSGGTVAGGVFTNSADQLYVADWNTGTKGLVINMTNGNVGIGGSPVYKTVISNNGAAGLEIDPTGQQFSGGVGIQTYNRTTSTYTPFQIYSSKLVLAGGNVGIGTSNPDYPLTVNGSIHAKEVRVDLSVPGPDYVFDKNYKLTPLEEIKSYIDQNKHLPDVPSASEMEKNGVQMGEMNMILLKKIEELTLHMIEMKQENEEMKKEIQELKAKK